jgi:hypothetical protein
MLTGRPRTLTPEKRSQIELLVSLGWTLKHAARRVGCAPCTLRREILRNRQFHEGIETAKRGFKAEMLQTMFHAAAKVDGARRWLEKNIRFTGEVDPFSPAPYPESLLTMPRRGARAAPSPPSAIRARKTSSTSARRGAQNTGQSRDNLSSKTLASTVRPARHCHLEKRRTPETARKTHCDSTFTQNKK